MSQTHKQSWTLVNGQPSSSSLDERETAKTKRQLQIWPQVTVPNHVIKKFLLPPLGKNGKTLPKVQHFAAFGGLLSFLFIHLKMFFFIYICIFFLAVTAAANRSWSGALRISKLEWNTLCSSDLVASFFLLLPQMSLPSRLLSSNSYATSSLFTSLYSFTLAAFQYIVGCLIYILFNAWTLTSMSN